MTRILFYSRKAYSYFTSRKASDMQIIDYFDIEFQKIIHFIGYRLKKDPVILINYFSNDDMLYYDLDLFKWTNHDEIKIDTINVISVIYS